jgi:sugar phosphate isomerase/epimerase
MRAQLVGNLRSVILSFNKTVVADGTLNWHAMIRVAGEAGYDAIDLPRSSDLLEEPAHATLGRLREAGLQAGPAIMPVNFREDDTTFAETFDGLEPFARYASALGSDVLLAILPASSEIPKEDLRPLCCASSSRVRPGAGRSWITTRAWVLRTAAYARATPE